MGRNTGRRPQAALGRGTVKAQWSSAARYGLFNCEECGLLSRASAGMHEGRCPRCHAALHFRKPNSIQRTWALVIAAAICYVPANLLPEMTTVTPFSKSSDTIMEGVVLLWSPSSWPLSVVVFVASVTIPLAKLFALAYLMITVQRGSLKSNRERTRLYRMIEFIGRWSMLDVFVDTFVVALVQLQPLMVVGPGPGVVFFAAVVVLTMIAVETFDPRLIWDQREANHA
jgi:paraquat-inducible protein A